MDTENVVYVYIWDLSEWSSIYSFDFIPQISLQQALAYAHASSGMANIILQEQSSILK